MHTQSIINDSIFRSALASKISYITSCKNTSRFPLLQLQGVKTCKIIDNKNTGAQMYVYESGTDSHIIAFRGTSNIKHIIKYCDTSMTTMNIKDRTFKVHSHILNLFHSLENDLSTLVFDSLTLKKKKYITFCGHSAGGSIAQFAAAYYGDLTNKNVVINCHSFGCPKVGDNDFVKWYEDNVNGESVNIVHRHDIVSILPFDTRYSSQKNVITFPDYNWNPFIVHDLDTYIKTLNNHLHLSRAIIDK
jgi:hypothetical protein